MSAPDRTIAQRVKTELTQQLWDRLLLHAVDLVKRATWHGILGGPSVCARDGADYVQIAILETLKGETRHWNPENCTLEQYLRGVIRSIVSNDATRAENRKFIRHDPTGCSESEEVQSPLDLIPAEAPSVSDLEYEEERQSLIFEFLEQLGDDKPVQQLFEAIYDGVTKRADQAARLNIPVTQVDALQKRLATRTNRFTEQKIKQRQEGSHE
ncbi:MAG TPA: hypothetical protein PK490_17965 [Prosthecobacter sp.]|nr:hypothetical protein [Prosthecobacter sp.]HRK16176.1 hypothetical protein [Prosthecobacter sp.]